MEKLEFPFDDLADEASMNDAVNALTRVHEQIDALCKKNGKLNKRDFTTLRENILGALSLWTGNTYIGERKDIRLRDAFQLFFVSLYYFLHHARTSKNKALRQFSHNTLYQGVVYRYLGSCNPSQPQTEPVSVEYNDIFVSWSKKASNPFVEGKLYGVLTRLTCEISGHVYGIDLTALGVSKHGEKEVVFQTDKRFITKTEHAETFCE